MYELGFASQKMMAFAQLQKKIGSTLDILQASCETSFVKFSK